MPHEKGAHPGSIRDVKTLRDRCVIDAGPRGCWHIRTSRGKPMPSNGARQCVWVHGIGPTTTTRAAWLASTGSLPPDGHTVYRTCASYDCVNPRHLASGTRQDMISAQALQGKFKTLARVLGLLRNRRPSTPADVVRWIRESTQPSKDIAHAVGLSTGRVNAIRRGEGGRALVPGASAFSVTARPAAANAAAMRRSA